MTQEDNNQKDPPEKKPKLKIEEISGSLTSEELDGASGGRADCTRRVSSCDSGCTPNYPTRVT